MEKNRKKVLYKYIERNHFAVHMKRAQYCKLTIVQRIKKKQEERAEALVRVNTAAKKRKSKTVPGVGGDPGAGRAIWGESKEEVMGGVGQRGRSRIPFQHEDPELPAETSGQKGPGARCVDESSLEGAGVSEKLSLGV